MGQTPWLVVHKRNPQAILRLFCFHYAGGNASVFRNWADYLEQPVELIALQLPGREERFNEALITDFALLIDKLVNIIIPYLDKPYVVFGHSLGTIISFEWIKALKKRQVKQPLLYIPAGRQAPHYPDKEPSIYHLPEEEFVQELLKKYQPTLGSVLENRDLRQLLLPMLQADFGLAETYKYQEGDRLNCPIMALAGKSEILIEENELQDWAKHTTDSFQCMRFPGDHFFIRYSEAQVLQKINQELAIIINTLKNTRTS